LYKSHSTIQYSQYIIKKAAPGGHPGAGEEKLFEKYDDRLLHPGIMVKRMTQRKHGRHYPATGNEGTGGVNEGTGGKTEGT
jgi:hypothetical protein